MSESWNNFVSKTIKDAAMRVIISIAPDYKQRNMTARSVEIADAKAQGTATPEDLADAEMIAVVWSKIKAVRAKSNELEAQYISAGKDLSPEDILSIKAELENA